MLEPELGAFSDMVKSAVPDCWHLIDEETPKRSNRSLISTKLVLTVKEQLSREAAWTVKEAIDEAIASKEITCGRHALRCTMESPPEMRPFNAIVAKALGEKAKRGYQNLRPQWRPNFTMY